jgi:hypothetical protein
MAGISIMAVGALLDMLVMVVGLLILLLAMAWLEVVEAGVVEFGIAA